MLCKQLAGGNPYLCKALIVSLHPAQYESPEPPASGRSKFSVRDLRSEGWRSGSLS